MHRTIFIGSLLALALAWLPTAIAAEADKCAALERSIAAADTFDAVERKVRELAFTPAEITQCKGRLSKSSRLFRLYNQALLAAQSKARTKAQALKRRSGGRSVASAALGHQPAPAPQAVKKKPPFQQFGRSPVETPRIVRVFPSQVSPGIAVLLEGSGFGDSVGTLQLKNGQHTSPIDVGW